MKSKKWVFLGLAMVLTATLILAGLVRNSRQTPRNDGSPAHGRAPETAS